MKNVADMTVAEFRALRQAEWDEEIICNGLVILPAADDDELHDSGYRCMGFVAIQKNEPVCILSGCSDVIHIDGISGYGENWLEKYDGCPKAVPPQAWSIDCLPTSGLLRIWPRSRRVKCGHAVSSFEIFALPFEKEAADE